MTRGLRLATAAALTTLVAAAGLYGTLHLTGNRTASTCAASAALLPKLSALAKGEVAAFQVEPKAAPATAVAFAAPDGSPRSLADFRGRTVLLNLWATWCEPCKREMPALDQLQARLGGPAFEAVAVNVDTRNLDRPNAWLKDASIVHLAAYSDHEAKIFQDLRRAGDAEGLPTTLLIGPDGCRLGRLAGWAEWASSDGLALITAAIGR